MHAVILSVLVVCCAVAYADSPGGYSRLEEEKWNEVTRIIERSLKQLTSEQGVYFILIKLNTVEYQVNAGTKYVSDAEFEDVLGDRHRSHVTLEVQDWKNFDELNMKCLVNEYTVTRGIRD